MAKITGLAHVGIFVADIERSKKFYDDVLGFETIFEFEVDEEAGVKKVAFVRNGDFTLEFIQRPNPQKLTGGLIDHIALAANDIAGVKDNLARRGVKFETEEILSNLKVFPKGTKWIKFRGPDGEILELNEVLDI